MTVDLQSCPVCASDTVARNAATCPHCGHVIRPAWVDIAIGVLAAGFVAAAVYVAIYLIARA